MPKRQSLKKSIAYNMAYQIISVIIPLITTPYLTRALGADGLGLFSKRAALAEYFYLFALLGVKNYGNRAVAQVRDDPKKTSRIFWEIYSLQGTVAAVVSVSYIFFCLTGDSNSRILFLILSLKVSSSVFYVDWYFYGMERFRLTTIRSIIIRLATLASIFLFVHRKEDLWVYVVTQGIEVALTALCMWPVVLKEIPFVKPRWNDVKKHIKPNLVLFWPVVAISLYNLMDKMILGYYSTNEEVAFYANAETLVIVPYNLILALDNVIMPRMSNIFIKNGQKQMQDLMDVMMMMVMMLSTALAFGLAGVSEVFAPWYYGTDFSRCGLYIMLLSPTVLIKSWAGALRTQYIIPTGKDRIYVLSLTAGAAVNLILDFALIPFLDGVGAIIGTIAAELTVASIQFVLCWRDIELKGYLLDGLFFCCFGMIMYLSVRLVAKIGLGALPTLLIQVPVGAAVYLSLAWLVMTRFRKRTKQLSDIRTLLK